MRANFAILLSTLLTLFLKPNPSLQFALNKDNIPTKQLDSLSPYNATFSDGSKPGRPAPPNPSPKISIPLTTVKGSWTGAISINNQNFRVVYDTGSSKTYVSGEGCVNCVNKYKPASGNAAVGSASVNLGSGLVQGTVYKDAITLPGCPDKLATDFVVANVVPTAMISAGLDGVLGMASFPITNQGETEIPPFFPNFFDEFPGYTPKFTFYPTPAGAQFTIGGDYSAGAITGTKTLQVTTGPYWGVALTSMTLGANPNSFTKINDAVFDTGSAYIRGPAAEVKALFASLDPTWVTASATGPGVYEVLCGKMPSISINFADDKSRAYVIPNAYIQEEEDKSISQMWCTVYILATNNNFWTLGTPFLSTVYSQFTVGKTGDDTYAGYTVGLAPVTLST